jgi:D-alanine transaminase
MLTKTGQTVDEDLHFNRLKNSLSYINVELQVSFEEISNIVQELYRKNSLQGKEGQVFIEITRGNLGMRSKGAPFTNKPTVLIVVREADYHGVRSEGIKQEISVMSCPDMRWQRRDIKTIQRLPNEMATERSKGLGYDDAIFIDNGIVTESPSSNLFIVVNREGKSDSKDNIELWTHPLTNKIIPGITRFRVIQIAKTLGYNIIEKSFEYNDLLNAREIFLTSSITRIRTVTKLDEVEMNNKEVSVSKEILQEYNKQF